MATILTVLFSSACPKAPPTAAPEPPPDEPPIEVFSKDADLSTMSDEDRRGYLMGLGEAVYLTGDGDGIACATCHQADGQGMPGAFPTLVGQGAWLADCGQLVGLVLDGMVGEIEVDAIKYNGVMVPQGHLLNDLQIAAVATYVRNAWGNAYGGCAPEDVAAVRGVD